MTDNKDAARIVGPDEQRGAKPERIVEGGVVPAVHAPAPTQGPSGPAGGSDTSGSAGEGE